MCILSLINKFSANSAQILFTLHKFPIPQHQQVDWKFTFRGEWVEVLIRLWLKAIVFDEGFVIHFRISKIDFKNL